MKKIFNYFIISHIIILIIVGIYIFANYKYSRKFYCYDSYISMSFREESSFENMILYAKKNGYEVSTLKIYKNGDIEIHINEHDFNKKFSLSNGTFPINGEQYVCNKKTKNKNQCGEINGFFLGHEIRIYNLNEPVDYKYKYNYVINNVKDDDILKMKNDLSSSGVNIITYEVNNYNPLLLFISSLTRFEYSLVVITIAFLFSELMCIIASLMIRWTIDTGSIRKKGFSFTNLLLIVNKYILSTGIIFLSILLFGATSRLFMENKNYKKWREYENIYKICINDIGQDESLEIEVELQKSISGLYGYLEENNGAFLMDADDIYFMEASGVDYPLNGLIEDGYSTHIIVSPKYFDINPIVTTNGNYIETELSYEENTINVLVPESYMKLSNQLSNRFIDYFNFHRNNIFDNVYSNAINDNWNPSKDKELDINIICVKDNQSYFTFNPNLRKGNKNCIIDPVVVVYTNNLHPSFLLAEASRCLYFYYDNADSKSVNDFISDIVGTKGVVYAESFQDNMRKRVLPLQIDCILCFIVLICGLIVYLKNDGLFMDIYYQTDAINKSKIRIVSLIVFFVSVLLSVFTFFALSSTVFNRLFFGLSLKPSFGGACFLLIISALMLEKNKIRRDI